MNRKLKGVRFPLITEKQKSRTFFHGEYSGRSVPVSKNSFWIKPSILNVLNVTISPSINEKLSNVSERRRWDIKSFVFVRENAIIAGSFTDCSSEMYVNSVVSLYHKREAASLTFEHKKSIINR